MKRAEGRREEEREVRGVGQGTEGQVEHTVVGNRFKSRICAPTKNIRGEGEKGRRGEGG